MMGLDEFEKKVKDLGYNIYEGKVDVSEYENQVYLSPEEFLKFLKDGKPLSDYVIKVRDWFYTKREVYKYYTFSYVVVRTSIKVQDYG